MRGVEELAEHDLAEVLPREKRGAGPEQRHAVGEHRPQQRGARVGRGRFRRGLPRVAQHPEGEPGHDQPLQGGEQRESDRERQQALARPPHEPNHDGLDDVERDRNERQRPEALQPEQGRATGRGEPVEHDDPRERREQPGQLGGVELVRESRGEDHEDHAREYPQAGLDPQRHPLRAPQHVQRPASLVFGGVALEEHLEIAGGRGREPGERERERHDAVLGGAEPAQQQSEVGDARNQRRSLLDREVEGPPRDVVRDLAGLHAVTPSRASSSDSR